MLLNTKQVRKLAQTLNVVASYTDKTQNNPQSRRRSVVFVIRNNPQQANALAQFLRSNCANKVTQTRTVRNYNTRCFGAEYVRVIADLA